MLAKRIASLQHSLVLHWSNLLKKRLYREETGSVLISGEKLIREIARELPIKALITLESAPGIPAEQRFLTTEGILKKITGLQTPDGYAAEVSLPPLHNPAACRRLLILDGIADPGNLGALLRTAHALGWDGAAATPGTVDFFNDKALRAAKGATFRIHLAHATPEEAALWTIPLFIADLEGDPLAEASRFQPPLALVLGNEARGPGSWKGKKIHIPMQKGAESLNVASAGAILMYAMRPL